MKSIHDSGVNTAVCHPKIDFLSAMNTAGLKFQGPIIADGVLHRFKANDDRNPNSFYALHLDGIAAGHFGCFKRGIKETWCAVGSNELTEAERAERDRRWREQQQARDAEKRRYQAEATTKAQAILDAARPATDEHPYLTKKAVKAAPGLLIGRWLNRDDCLLIPLRNATGQLATLQAISPDAPFAHSGQTKDFLRGGAKAGAYFVIGDTESSPVILLAEGYATAATLHEATGYAAVMCCDAGGLKAVAQALKTLYPPPAKTILICGDNDRFTEGNPGAKAARAASKASGVRVIIPDFTEDEPGSDFNDLAALRGMEAVKAGIDDALSRAWQLGKDARQGPTFTFNPAPDSSWRQVDDDEPPDMPEGGTARGTAGEFTNHDPRLARKTGTSELLKTHYNAVMVAELAIPGLIGYNEFRQRIEKRINPPWGGGPGQWTERDTSELACYVAKPFAHFGLDLLGGAIMGVAHRHPFNPGQDRLRALAEQWDGVPRIDSWLVDYLNAKVNSSNSDYLREIGACWIKGVAARVLKPGCKRDDVMVLRGDQGWRKSTAARIIADAIAPDAFTDCLGDLGSKDARGGIRGVVIAELGELASLNKSDVESVKAFVAAPSDRFREAYGRGERDYPRTVSFIGTTNHPTFLQDPTGNRRWWPVSMSGPIDTDLLTDAMPQILGEAARRVLKGEAWHVTHTAALAQAESVRAAHFEDDVWTAPALAAVDRLGGDYVTVGEILSAMNIRLEQQTMTAQKRIGGILRTNGYQDQRRRVNGRRAYVWCLSPLPPLSPDRGDSPEASQTAACPPVPPCPPYQHNLVKNAVEEAGDTTPTPTPTPETATGAPAISTLCRKEGGQGGQGGQTRQTLAETPAPLPVPLISRGDTAPPSTPVEMPPMSGDAARLADVLKLFRGAETDKRLARKMGWSVSRLAGAAGVLATAGLAEVHGEMIKPAGRLVAAV